MEHPDERPSKTWRLVFVATVLASVAAALVFVAFSELADPGSTAGTSSNVLTAELTNLDGSSVTIEDQLDGRPIVVNFFQSYCAPCVREMPAFQVVSQELDGRVGFYGVAVQDRPEDAVAIVRATGVTYPWSRDIRGEVLAASRSASLPTTLLVDAGGEVLEVHVGALDADRLRNMIRTQLGVSG